MAKVQGSDFSIFYLSIFFITAVLYLHSCFFPPTYLKFLQLCFPCVTVSTLLYLPMYQLLHTMSIYCMRVLAKTYQGFVFYLCSLYCVV